MFLHCTVGGKGTSLDLVSENFQNILLLEKEYFWVVVYQYCYPFKGQI